MRKFQIILSVVVLLITGVSCRQKSNKEFITYSAFPREAELTGYTVELDTVIFRYPYTIDITNNRAIVHDLHNADNYFHLFNYPDFTYERSFGRRGSGPREMVTADHFTVTDGGASLWALDGSKSVVTRLLPDEDLKVAETISLDPRIMRTFNWHVYNDSLFVTVDFSGESRLLWLNREGEIVGKTGEIPTVRNVELRKEQPFPLSMAWRIFTDYNPDNGILAAVTQYGEVLEIYDLKNDSCHVEYGPLGEPRFGLLRSGSIIPVNMGFQSVRVTGNYIYTVFSGIPYKEFVETAKAGAPESGGNYLQVYTLQGEPVVRYRLDRRLSGFEIDEENNRLIGLALNLDEPITVYELESI